MSNEKHHIDDLFKKLNNLSPEVNEGDWDTLLNKMHDSAWKDKFEQFEPESSENIVPPAFDKVQDEAWKEKFAAFVPLTQNPEFIEMEWQSLSNKMHDEAWKEKFANYEPHQEAEDAFVFANAANTKGISPLKGAWSYFGLLLVLSALIFTTWWIFASKEVSGELIMAEEVVNQTEDFEDVNIDFEKPENDMQDSELNESTYKTKNDFEQGKQGQEYMTIKSSKYKASLQNSRLNDELVREKVDETVVENEIKKVQENTQENNTAIDEIQNQTAQDHKIVKAADNQELPSEATIVSKEKESELTSELAPQDEKKSEVTTLEDSTKSTKTRTNFFIASGGGLTLMMPPYSNSKALPGLSLTLNAGLQKGIWSAATGLESQNLNFSNRSIILRKVDSIPHLNPNGDTIGWFERNERDTSLNGNFDSRINVVRIPVRMNTRVFSSPRFEVWIGAGTNLNIYKSKGVYAQQNNGRSFDLPKGSADLRRYQLGYHADLLLHYKLNQHAGIFLGANYWRDSNISKINEINLRSNVISVNFGLKYMLK